MALKKMWQNDYFKMAVVIVIIVAVFLGFFFGLQIGLHTSSPVLVVVSQSMYIPSDGNTYVGQDQSGSVLPTAHNIWLSLTHPFSRTLNVGDIVIVEGVNTSDLNANYPNSDIIIFHSPGPADKGELIVHRIISKETINGTVYYQTKGDGNGNPWPQTPTSGQDPWDSNNPPGVPQSDVVGKVVMRIPWLGWITMILRDNTLGLPVIITIIILLVIIEFVVPILRKKKPPEKSRIEVHS